MEIRVHSDGGHRNARAIPVPMPSQLERRLLKHLQNHDEKTDLLFVNRHGRPLAVNKLAGALHTDRVGCTLSVAREVKMEIPVKYLLTC
jgi:hypothetical protein